jgi:hypothetical protein
MAERVVNSVGDWVQSPGFGGAALLGVSVVFALTLRRSADANSGERMFYWRVRLSARARCNHALIARDK